MQNLQKTTEKNLINLHK